MSELENKIFMALQRANLVTTVHAREELSKSLADILRAEIDARIREALDQKLMLRNTETLKSSDAEPLCFDSYHFNERINKLTDICPTCGKTA